MEHAKELVCPCCKVERPAKEIVKLEEGLYQCRICIMLNKEPVYGDPRTKEEIAKETVKPKPKVVKPVPKKEHTSEFCPGCLTNKLIEAFTENGKVYRFCNECRTNEIELMNERARRLLGNGLFSNISFTLGRCYRCGHIGDIRKDFDIDVKSATGFRPYCKSKCNGRRG